MKIKLEIDIPADDYATLTKWLKCYVADNTVKKVLERGMKMDVAKFLSCARAHMKTGKDAFRRFQETLQQEENDV